MPRYFCSLPNERKAGRIPQLVTDDAEAIAAFVKRWDVDGRGTFYCVSTLKPGEYRRSRETFNAIEELHVDLDPKDLVESLDVVDGKLEQLSLPPSEVRTSGRGRHVLWRLKEPLTDMDEADRLLKRLKDYLCGDPNPAHPVALLRMPGSFNTKNGGRLPCRTLAETPHRYDPSDIADWLDDVAHVPMFTRRTAPKSNGHAGDTPEFAAHDGPLDVEACLAGMEPNGASVNDIQPRAILSLLQKAIHPDDVVTTVVDATMEMAEHHNLGWDRGKEVGYVTDRCRSSLSKLHGEYDPSTGTIPTWLAGEFHQAWIDALAADKRPQLSRNAAGWYVRGWSAEKNGSEAADAKAGPSATKAGPTLLDVPTFMPFDVAGLPPRAWLYGRHYQRRTVSATVAPGGTGKTSLILTEAIVMATCRPLLGEQPEERCRVWYHNGEENRPELMRRIAAVCQHYTLDMSELTDWLFVTTGNELPLKVAQGYSNLEINDALLRRMGATVAEKKFDIVALDPLVTLHGVPEGDNNKMNTVVRLFSGMADTCDCSFELSHHMRKLAAGVVDYTAEDMRGASAIKDAVRASRLLNLISSKDAEAAGISDLERPSYFRVDRGKANHTAPAKVAVWRRFISVDLPNGDDVGVVVPWDYPGQDGVPSAAKTATDRAAETVFLQLLDKFEAAGRDVSDKAGSRFAPALFAEEREAKQGKLGKAHFAKAMRRLFDAGTIHCEEHGRADRPSRRLKRVRLA